MVDVDWLKILDASDNVLLTFDFTQSVVMEVTDTYMKITAYTTNTSAQSPVMEVGEAKKQ